MIISDKWGKKNDNLTGKETVSVRRTEQLLYKCLILTFFRFKKIA